MELSAKLCASIVALALLALTADGASAAPFNNSKSNTYKIDATAPNGDKLCISGGGKVVTAADGTKTCDMAGTAILQPTGTVQPSFTGTGAAAPGPADLRAVKSSKSNSSEKTGIVKLPEGTEVVTPGRATHGQTMGETAVTSDGCTKDQANSDEASKGSVSSYRMAQGSTAPTANPCNAIARQVRKPNTSQ